MAGNKEDLQALIDMCGKAGASTGTSWGLAWVLVSTIHHTTSGIAKNHRVPGLAFADNIVLMAENTEDKPSTSLAAKDRQKRRAKLVDTSWRQASGAGILPEEWDLFTERSQEPSVQRALEVNLDGPGKRARPASEPRGSSSSFRRIVWRRGCCSARALNSNLHCSGKVFKLVERLMQVASTSADCLMQSTATLAVRLTQSTAIPHAPARQALSPTGRIPASNQRRFLIGGFDLLADARGQKGL
ncbi:hypothetical protein HPB50_024691 [Hyalomma asiaticum]|uniref:Uncharacterized protein n=1 Tax=Hyalomma asiaticum TaxID=266040 RepID=A0ACB7SC50_HYAAI|nr:hypothetical protein HPB50_024691 [Hyalomma asiaticum]